MRRRKLADKGIIPETAGGMGTPGFSSLGSAEGKGGGGSGGWSEVAKKGPIGSGSSGAVKDGERERESFRVVAGKKKGKRG